MWTGDERVFFYNPTTRLSMWDRPEDLIGRADVDKIIQEPPHKRGLEDDKKYCEFIILCHFMTKWAKCKLFPPLIVKIAVMKI